MSEFEVDRRKFGMVALGAAATGIAASSAAAQLPGPSAVDDPTALPIPAQRIPVPKSLSNEAQAFLTAAHRRIAAIQAGGKTAGGGVPGAGQASMETILQYLRPGAARFKGTTETIDLGHGAKLYRFIPDGRKGRRAQVAISTFMVADSRRVEAKCASCLRRPDRRTSASRYMRSITV